jgi:hypothetical protein
VKQPTKGAERIDYLRVFSFLAGSIIFSIALFNISGSNWKNFSFITPNFINQVLLGLCLILHANISAFLRAVDEAISGASGILIQFPLYFGIMGIMNESGLIALFSDGFIAISSPQSFPLWSFFSAGLVNIFVQLGLCSPKRLDEIKSANELLVSTSDTIKTEARKLADFLDGKVGVFYSSARYEGVAIRARQQFEENSKYLCWHHVIPEMNHNELVGWGGGDDRFAVVFMQTGDLIPRNQKRYDITMDRIKTFTPHVTEIVAKGTCPIERSFYLIHLVDWSSLYLAQKKGVDEFDIDVIYYLKDELAKFQG